jgi:hypothetical protein
VVLERSIIAATGTRYGIRIYRPVDDERGDASDGRDLHSWIERTTECVDGTRSDIKALTPVGVWQKM